MRIGQVVLWKFVPHRILEIGPLVTRLFPLSGKDKGSVEVATPLVREIFLAELNEEVYGK